MTPESIWKKYAPIANENLDAIPKSIRPIVTTYSAQGVIDNGGFTYFFECNWPGIDDWSIFVDDFSAIGHKDGAKAILTALGFFPGGKPQDNLEERRRHIFEVLGGIDGALGKLDGVICGKSFLLDQLLEDYVKTNRIAEQDAAANP